MIELGPEKALIDAGFADGWAIRDGVLVLWEHDEEPPAPFTRPAQTE